jgi:hypothetical protein
MPSSGTLVSWSDGQLREGATEKTLHGIPCRLAHFDQHMATGCQCKSHRCMAEHFCDTSGWTPSSSRRALRLRQRLGHDHAVECVLHQARFFVHKIWIGADRLEMGGAWNVERDLGSVLICRYGAR